MKKIIPLLLCFCTIKSTAQIFSIKEKYRSHIDSKKNSWSFGLSGNMGRIVDGFSTPPFKYYFPTIGFKVGYNVAARTTVGLEYAHQPVWGTILPDVTHLYYTGPYAQYDIWRRKNTFFLALNYNLSNASWYNAAFNKEPLVQYAGVGFGFRLKMYPNIYATYAHIWQFNLTHPEASTRYDSRLGVSLAFNSKTNDIPIQVSNTKRDRTSKLLFGITGSYIYFDNSEFVGGYDWYESTMRFGFYQSSFLSMGWYGRLAVGHSHLPNYPNNFFYFTGPFVNIKLNALHKWNYFAEIALLKSNFTLLSGGATNELPQDGNAQYFSSTTGIAYRINNNMAIELGINMSNVISTDANKIYGAGGYRLGIEKTFKLKHRETVRSF